MRSSFHQHLRALERKRAKLACEKDNAESKALKEVAQTACTALTLRASWPCVLPRAHCAWRVSVQRENPFLAS